MPVKLYRLVAATVALFAAVCFSGPDTEVDDTEIIQEPEIIVSEIEPEIEEPTLPIAKNYVNAPEVQEQQDEEPIDYSEYYTAEDVELIASIVYGEVSDVGTTTEKAAIVWTILNRVDAWDQTIKEVTMMPNQFWRGGMENTNELSVEARRVTVDVLQRWVREHNGETDVGRVLPPEYLYFRAGPNGTRIVFTLDCPGYVFYEFDMGNPYGEVIEIDW